MCVRFGYHGNILPNSCRASKIRRLCHIRSCRLPLQKEVLSLEEKMVSKSAENVNAGVRLAPPPPPYGAILRARRPRSTRCVPQPAERRTASARMSAEKTLDYLERPTMEQRYRTYSAYDHRGLTRRERTNRLYSKDHRTRSELFLLVCAALFQLSRKN